jgi:hypothetical protein
LPLGLFAWAVLWLVVVSAGSLSPPFDNAEQLMWVRSLQWGYYKHPPLPTVLLWPLVRRFGLHPATSYVAGALLTTGGLGVCAWLVQRIAGSRVAVLSLLGTMCVGYYNSRIHYYNHNTVLMACVIGAAVCCWLALAERRPLAWPALGLAIGLGALSKYQVALAMVSVLALWLAERGWRDALHRRGLVQAAAVAALLFAPHAVWLVEHDFPPVHYAVGSSLGAAQSWGGRLADGFNWAGDQLGRIAPALLFLALALGRRTASGPAVAPRGSIARRFFFCWGLLPLLAISAIGLLSGADLQAQWGTAFMPLTCAWVLVRLRAGRLQALQWPRAMRAFVLMQVLLVATNLLTSPFGPALLARHMSRGFPSQALADDLAAQARPALGRIRFIAGPSEEAGAIALRLAERPRVVIDGRFDISPWADASDAMRCGVLWLGRDGAPGAAPPALPRHALTAGLWWAVQAPDGRGCD